MYPILQNVLGRDCVDMHRLRDARRPDMLTHASSTHDSNRVCVGCNNITLQIYTRTNHHKLAIVTHAQTKLALQNFRQISSGSPAFSTTWCISHTQQGTVHWVRCMAHKMLHTCACMCDMLTKNLIKPNGNEIVVCTFSLVRIHFPCMQTRKVKFVFSVCVHSYHMFGFMCGHVFVPSVFSGFGHNWPENCGR